MSKYLFFFRTKLSFSFSDQKKLVLFFHTLCCSNFFVLIIELLIVASNPTWIAESKRGSRWTTLCFAVIGKEINAASTLLLLERKSMLAR
jgi:hypothetical protein